MRRTQKYANHSRTRQLQPTEYFLSHKWWTWRSSSKILLETWNYLKTAVVMDLVTREDNEYFCFKENWLYPDLEPPRDVCTDEYWWPYNLHTALLVAPNPLTHRAPVIWRSITAAAHTRGHRFKIRTKNCRPVTFLLIQSEHENAAPALLRNATNVYARRGIPAVKVRMPKWCDRSWCLR